MLGLVLAAANDVDVDVSVGGIILGLLLGALVFFVAEWLLSQARFGYARAVAAILALLVFLVCAFDFIG